MSVIILFIIGKIVLSAGIPASYQMYERFLYLWGPGGKVFRVDLMEETFSEMSSGFGKMKLIYKSGKKSCYLHRKSRELIVVNGKEKKKLRLSEHLPFGYAFRIFNDKIYFLLLRDSLMFEVLDLSGDSLYGFLKRDKEDSIVTAFSISRSRVIVFNPIQSTLKIYNLVSLDRATIKVEPLMLGLWGLFRGGGSLKYLGGVAEIVELDDGSILLSCFSYPTRRSIKPLTYIMRVPDVKILKSYDDPTFLVGKLGDKLVFITYRKGEVEIWKESLSE